MDDKNILSDDNLNRLNLINKIDTYSIVEREFNKKGENKNLCILLGAIATIISFVVIFIIINKINPSYIFVEESIIKKMIQNKILLKALTGYYVLCVWALMLLVVPIMKRKRLRLN